MQFKTASTKCLKSRCGGGIGLFVMALNTASIVGKFGWAADNWRPNRKYRIGINIIFIINNIDNIVVICICMTDIANYHETVHKPNRCYTVAPVADYESSDFRRCGFLQETRSVCSWPPTHSRNEAGTREN